MNSNQNLTIGALALRFLANFSCEEKERRHQDVYKFVRWLGWDRPIAGITAHEVAKYAEQLSSATDSIKAVESIRAFLSYINKEGYLRTDLATQLKAKRGKSKLSRSSRQSLPPIISLTRQGYCELEAQLSALKSRRLEVIDEMRKAAADKDFRENAPLQAARDESGHLEGRIAELEETLKSAIIIDEKQDDKHKIGIGDRVILRDLDSGEEVCYTIVGSKEVDLNRRRISSVSPLGKAIVGRAHGETIEVETPAGKLYYQIKESG